MTAICSNSTRGTSDANVIAGYTYLGLATPVTKDYPIPKVKLDLWGGTTGTYAGLDQFQRVASQDWVDYNSTAFDVFKLNHGYDRDSNRTYAANVTQPAAGVDPPYTGSSHVYTYDNLNRLTSDVKGLIASDNGSIQSYWQTMNDSWGLDTLGNQTTASAGSGNSSMVTNTPNSINEYTGHSGSSNGFQTELSAADPLISSSGNWSLPSGSSATFSIASGKLTIGSVATNTFGGYTEEESRAMVLWGASLGSCWSGANVTFPSGATSGQAGFIFGYKGPNDYWIRVFDIGAQTEALYHVVNGTKSLAASVSATVTAGTDYSLELSSTRSILAYPFNWALGSGGYPGGKVGVYSTIAGVTCDTPTVLDNPRPFPLYGRWEGTSYNANAYGLILQTGASGQQGPLYMQNLRLQKFQATFAMLPYAGGGNNAVQFVFNGNDRDDYDAVQLGAGSGSNWPYAFVKPNGTNGYDAGGEIAGSPADGGYSPMWCRVQFDGTTLKVWQLIGTGSPPSETDWAGATQVVSSTGCRYSGGKIGFCNPYSGIATNVTHLTVKNYNTSSSAFDITEATDDFTIDGSSNGNNSLASDSNGNQTFDGTQVYTYDGWNRLMTVSHGYRDSGGTVQHGQALDTMAYDGKGRRISKLVNNTGSWDCAYQYFYNGNRQVEVWNGSNQVIKQFVWGLGYIDDLEQVALSSNPGTTACDTPYWAMQDANFNVLGIVDGSGVLKERYEYSAYGQRIFYIGSGSNDSFCTAPTVGSQRFVASAGTEAYGLCEVGHQGLMQDEECGLVVADHRYLQPGLGRWMSRDPIGDIAMTAMRRSSDLDSTTLSALGTAALRIKSGLGGRSLGDPAAWSYASGLSLYETEYSNPIDFTDPSGLMAPNCVGNNLRNCKKSGGKWDSLANNLYAGSMTNCISACEANFWIAHIVTRGGNVIGAGLGGGAGVVIGAGLGPPGSVGAAAGGAVIGGAAGATVGGYADFGICGLSCAGGGCSTSQTPW